MNAPETRCAPAEIELEILQQLGTAIVTLRGEHDVTTRPGIENALSQASEYPSVLVDFSDCTFADSSVIAALFVAQREIARRDGRLELVIPPRATAVRRVADLTGLGAMIPIAPARNGIRRETGAGAA